MFCVLRFDKGVKVRRRLEIGHSRYNNQLPTNYPSHLVGYQQGRVLLRIPNESRTGDRDDWLQRVTNESNC